MARSKSTTKTCPDGTVVRFNQRCPIVSGGTAGQTTLAPVNTSLPTITGTVQKGVSLTCSTGAWDDAPTAFAYQWKVAGVNAGTGSSYTIKAADVGSNVTCVVTASNLGGSVTATATGVGPVIDLAPVLSVAPLASGTATVGQTISVTNGTWTNSPTSYSYQWLRNGSTISGATFTAYQPVSADNGAALSCAVTATNSGGSASGTSNGIGPVGSISTGYDSSIGVGVDIDGFANLPLRTAAAQGADLVTAAPTSHGASITYTSGARTLSGTAASGGLIGRWDSVLTIGETYRIQVALHLNSGYAFLYLYDENGTVQKILYNGDNGGAAVDKLIDTTFIATGTSVVLKEGGDDAFTGSVAMGVVATATGVPARRFFVNATTGSDTSNGVQAQSPSSPVATIAQAVKYVQAGLADQILVAESTTYSASIPLLVGCSGAGLGYPFVIQSYDRADALNEAKYGRASGTKRPVFTATGGQSITNSAAAVNYVAIRGLDFNPGNTAGNVLNLNSPTTAGNGGFLFENNLFRYTSLALDQLNNASGVRGKRHIIRNNSFFGVWAASGHIQPIYTDTIENLTMEDNVIYHGGWKIGATRDDTTANGGLAGDEVFRHSCYIQNTCYSTIYRRNLVIDGPADGGHLLGDTTATENLIIDCPIGLDLTGGVSYETVRPSGVDYQASYNVILGTNDIRSGNVSYGRGVGINTRNGSSGSSAHHNLIVRNTGIDSYAFETAANFSKPSYMDFHDNVSYLQNSSGRTHVDVNDGSTGAVVHTTYTSNKWDDAASGSNTQSTAGSFANPYTEAALYTAAGYASRQAFIDYAILNPEAHPGRALYNLALTGYGIAHSI